MDQVIEETGAIFLAAVTLLLVIRLFYHFLYTQDVLRNMIDVWVCQMIK